MTDIYVLRKPQPPRPKRPIIIRLIAGVLLGLVLLYLLFVTAIFAFQRHLEYPGAYRTALRLDAALPTGWQSVDLTVPDGGPVKIWQARPAAQGAPTIVLFHGNDMSTLDLMPLAEAFHREGYGAVLAGYRGYSGNPGSPTETGLLADGRAAVALAAKDGPVILFGHSLGAGVAADIAASDNKISGLILSAPVTSIANVMARRLPFVPIRYLTLDKYDILSDIPHIQCPILIIHGDADKVAPIAESKRLAEAASGHASLVVIEGGDHNSVWLDGIDAAQNFVSQIAYALRPPPMPEAAPTPPLHHGRHRHRHSG